jgi:hypothetical protein
MDVATPARSSTLADERQISILPGGNVSLMAEITFDGSASTLMSS